MRKTLIPAAILFSSFASAACADQIDDLIKRQRDIELQTAAQCDKESTTIGDCLSGDDFDDSVSVDASVDSLDNPKGDRPQFVIKCTNGALEIGFKKYGSVMKGPDKFASFRYRVGKREPIKARLRMSESSVYSWYAFEDQTGRTFLQGLIAGGNDAFVVEIAPRGQASIKGRYHIRNAVEAAGALLQLCPNAAPAQ